MEIETGLGIDAISNEPVKDIVSKWKRKVDTEQDLGNLFSMFWIAGPDEKITKAIGYITEQLGIDRSTVIEFEVDPDRPDVTNKLCQFADKVRLVSESRVLMIARGFEKVLANVTEPYNLTRAGHDWDQNVVEYSRDRLWCKPYSGIDKHIVIITTIGFSAGPEAYEKAAISAARSLFKKGYIRFE